MLRFPTLFVCGFIGLAALQSLFAGLMLSNMALKNRRDFEYRLTLVTCRVRREEYQLSPVEIHFLEAFEAEQKKLKGK